MRDRQQAIQLIKEACHAGARQSKACELLGITQRTYQRWSLPDGDTDRRKQACKVPGNKLTDTERERIILLANSEDYADLPPCQIVPRLADQGCYVASESTFYRVLRAANQLQHRQRTRPKSHRKPRELVAAGPNQVWSWDISYLATTVFGVFYYLYLVLDIFSRKIVGWSVHEKESSDYASLLVQDICDEEGIDRNQLTLHSDNGAPMKGATLLATLQHLGVATSFSRPAVSNDNPYSESLFKTIKYCYFYPDQPFNSLGEARRWLLRFVRWYNTQHYHSALKFTTPEQRHQGFSESIALKRKAVYEHAKKLKPARWSGATRNWDLPKQVVLNPMGKSKVKEDDSTNLLNEAI